MVFRAVRFPRKTVRIRRRIRPAHRFCQALQQRDSRPQTPGAQRGRELGTCRNDIPGLHSRILGVTTGVRQTRETNQVDWRKVEEKLKSAEEVIEKRHPSERQTWRKAREDRTSHERSLCFMLFFRICFPRSPIPKLASTATRQFQLPADSRSARDRQPK
jgi:hypothetical protein